MEMENQFWQVTDDGYVFAFSDEIHSDSVAQLTWNQLEMLWGQGLAEIQGNHQALVPHDKAVLLDRGTKEELGLPDTFPFTISLKMQGNLSSLNFSYRVHFLDYDGRPFMGVKPQGSFIELNQYGSGTCYMFSKVQYQLLKTVQECNQKVKELANSGALRPDVLNSNSIYTAKVQEYARCVQSKLDDYIKKQKIVTADKLSIRVEENPDHSYSIVPVLLQKRGEQYFPIEDKKFEETFRRSSLSSKTFVAEDKTRYVFTPEQEKCIEKIRGYGRLPENEAEQILRTPKEFFDSPEFIFDLDEYSDRVAEIGKFKKISVPYVKPEINQWLPAEGTTIIGDENESEFPEFTPSNIEDINRTLQDALNKGQREVVIDDKPYEITPALLARVKEEKHKLDIKLDNSEQSQNAKKVHSGEKPVLNIKQNIEKLRYRAEQRSKQYSDLNPETLFSGLRQDISLFPHQKEGVLCIAEQWKAGHKGVLLADDMGLGKTAQAYAFISGLKKANPGVTPSVLIVAPVSLLKNWQDEYGKFVEAGIFEDVVPLYGNEIKKYKKPNAHAMLKLQEGKLEPIQYIDFSKIQINHIVLTTYETLRDFQLSFGQVEWSVMIIDEAQKIKNPGSRISSAVRAMKYEFGLAMTGTPVENSWVDLWTIMDFVEPGKLDTLAHFNDIYIKRLKTLHGKTEQIEVLGNQLREELNPIFIRRLKSDISSDLPAKVIRKFPDPMTAEQKKEYEAVISRARQKDKSTKGYMLKVIAELRDISLCPHLGMYNNHIVNEMSAESFFGTSARLIRTKEILDEIQQKQEKVIIFLESKKLQLFMKTYLEQLYQIEVPTPINGEMDAYKRQKIVKEFNNAPGFRILILSPLAAGVGLNIVGANHVIHLSRSWNPAKEDQATDRAYRIGQKKDVTVYIPMAIDPDYSEQESFDANLDHLLDYKRKLGETALYPTGDSEENGYRMFENIIRFGEEKEEDSSFWRAEELRTVNGKAFEKIITDLLNATGKYKAVRTQDSGDRGADVVALGQTGADGNLVVQCKQTAGSQKMNLRGVQEVVTSKDYYGKLYQKIFNCAVITNALDFTKEAKELAHANGVKLIAYEELDDLLKKYPVKKNA